MSRLATLAACAVFTVSASESDKHPLADEEKYLEPYLEELIDYRDHPIAERYIMLADLVDAPPTWIEDLFIPLLIPGSSLTIPLNMTIPFKIPGTKIPLPSSFTLDNVTVNDLNKFKTLRPLKLRKDARFSWKSDISLKNLEIVASAYLEVLKKRVDVRVVMPLVKPTVQLSTVIAFNRTRLCGVWGSTMRSSLNCAAWALAHHEEHNVSGVNLTTFEIGLDDFDFSLNVTGLGDDLDQTLQTELEEAITAAKPLILSMMPNISSAVQETLNNELLHSIPDLQRRLPCEGVPEASSDHTFVIEGAGDSEFNGYFVADGKKNGRTQYRSLSSKATCNYAEQDDKGYWYLAHEYSGYWYKSGDAGVDADLPPTTGWMLGTSGHAPIPSLSYELPVAKAYNVSRICVSNNGLDVLRLNLHDCPAHFVSSKTWPSLPDGRKCTDVAQLVDDVAEGDSVRVAMQAVLGVHEIIDPELRYVPDSNVAGFECSGTEVLYKCKFVSLAPVDPTVLPKVSQVCVINHMFGLVINFKEQNQRTGEWTKRTKDFPEQTKRCVDLGSIDGVVEGDVFKTKVGATLALSKFTNNDVEYSNNGLSVTFECRGTSVMDLFTCTMLGSPSPLASLIV